MNSLLNNNLTQENGMGLIKFSYRWLWILISMIFVLLLGYIDFITGYEISLSIFYLLPISLLAWYSGRRDAYFISILSGIVLMIADFKSDDYDMPYSIAAWNTTAAVLYYLLISYFLSTIRKLYDNEKIFARTDPLTGAINRRYFYKLAVNEIERSQRFQRPVSLAYIDIDNFKTINDTLGHSAGDELLKIVTGSIRENLRIYDVLSRLGGDEFAILLPETGEDHVCEVINKIQNILMDDVRKNRWPISLSIGVVTCRDNNYTFDELVKTADAVMYSVKENGKNNVKYHIFGNVVI